MQTELGLRVSDALMEELFEYRLLVRTSQGIGERIIGFYFQQLRDYVIAFGVLQLDTIAPADVKREFDAATFPSTRGDVFTLYYRLAARERRLIFDSEVRGNATRYLRRYTSLIQEHFPAIRSELSPCTESPVGFVGELVLSRGSVGLHGFRPLEAGDDDVHFVPVQQMAGKSNLASLEGVGGMHTTSTAEGFRHGIDVSAVVVDFELLPQIRDLVKKGHLNESGNPDLLAEFVTESVLLHRDIFNSLLTPNGRSINYPLNLESVMTCLSRAKLTRHFRDEIVRRKRRAGEIREQWSGTMVSWAHSLTADDEAEVVQRVNQALSRAEMPVFRARYVELERLEKRLGSAVKVLRSMRQEIVEPIVAGLGQLDLMRSPAELRCSAGQLKEALRSLYLRFLSNYRHLVETNFPTLRSHFRLYAEPAKTIYVTLGLPIEGDFDISLTMVVAKSLSGESTVEFVDEIKYARGEGGSGYEIRGVVHKEVSRTRTTVGRFIGNGGSFGRMHLRTLVYGRIQQELAAVENVFRSEVRQTE